MQSRRDSEVDRISSRQTSTEGAATFAEIDDLE